MARREVSFSAGLAKLERQGSKGAKERPEPPTLPVASIATAEHVFQPRIFEAAGQTDELHTRELARAIDRAGGDGRLEPILVMWIGRKVYCIDGHHRLAAYRKVRPRASINVEWFRGSVREAVAEAARRNSRDKLRMHAQEKAEVAWRMTLMGGYSKSQVAEAASVSQATVATMRKVLKEIEAKAEEALRDFSQAVPDPHMMTWPEARAFGRHLPEIGEEWEERLAEDWASRLSREFGPKLGKLPSVAARALALYSNRLPRQLIESWPDEVRNMAELLSDEDELL